MTEKAVSIQDMSRIHLIFGDFDNNINIIQKEYKVSIFTRDDEIRIKGDENAVDNAEQVIKTLISTVEKGETPTEQSVRYAISMTNEGKGEEVQTLTADCICVSHTGKPIKAKTVADDLQCVGQAGQRNDGGAVLVVVEDGDIAALFELAFDLKASGRGNILKVDAAERAGDERDGIDEFVYIVRLDAQREGIHIAEGLEEHAFALHDRHAGLRADVAKAENGRAVGNDRAEIPAAR